jgi:adenine deaminase
VLDVLRAASLNPVRHYGLPLGLLQAGDPADFVIVDDLATLTVLETVIDGRCVWREGQPLFDVPGGARPNRFEPVLRRVEEFAVRGRDGQMRVIEVRDRQLVTGASLEPASCRDGYAVSDPSRDLLKIAVVNRYTAAPVAVGFVKNVGLQEGAVASSIAHDAHNIVAVGVRDCDICRAVNRVVEHRGALVVVWGEDDEVVLPLPIAGLMSDSDGARVARMYAGAEAAARRLGSSLSAPLMTLSFLSLSVIPELKLTDLGLFDGRSFEHVPLFVS